MWTLLVGRQPARRRTVSPALTVSASRPHGGHRSRLDNVALVLTLVWLVAGTTIAVAALGDVNHDALPIVLIATGLGVLSAAGAAWGVHQGRCGLACGLLLVSVVVPTYAAWALNLLPIVAVALLLPGRRAARPGWTTSQSTT